MTKEKIIEKLDKIVPKYFAGKYTFVGYVENIYGEPFILFKVARKKGYFVTGSELDWEVNNFYSNMRWYSEDDERAKIISAIQEYEAKN